MRYECAMVGSGSVIVWERGLITLGWCVAVALYDAGNECIYYIS